MTQGRVFASPPNPRRLEGYHYLAALIAEVAGVRRRGPACLAALPPSVWQSLIIVVRPD